MEVKIEPRTVFGFIFIILGVIVILIAVIQAFLPMEDISTLTVDQALVESLRLLFVLVVKLIGGFFLAVIGLRVFKK